MNRQKKNLKLANRESLAAIYTHTLIIGLSDFLTNFKSKKFKKFFNHEKDLINLKNDEKSFNQKFQEKEFKGEKYFNQKYLKNDFKNNFKSNLKTGILSLNSGITLIALIITIIVLLILAGVTISAIMRRKRNIKSSSKWSR